MPITQRTWICATLHATSVQEAVQQLKQAADDGADLVELRLDRLNLGANPQTDLEQLLAASTLPLIAACRPRCVLS